MKKSLFCAWQIAGCCISFINNSESIQLAVKIFFLYVKSSDKVTPKENTDPYLNLFLIK